MIVKFAQVGKDGVVVAVCQTAQVEFERGLNDPTLGVDYVLIPDDANENDVLANWYRKNGEWLIRPARPTEFHEWDRESESWLPNIVEAKKTLKADVQNELSRRSVSPIVVGDIVLDADAVAQNNLANKLQEVNERIRLGMPMPSDLLVWKDASNAVRCWANIESYKDWLSTFAIALAERGTRLYQAAWSHKDAIEAMTTIDDVLAYDASIGWPE